MHDFPAIVAAILDSYALPVRGDHGIVHWARVMENGLRIAQATGADHEVVRLFGLFHCPGMIQQESCLDRPMWG
jgi:uncharacterized protein